MTERRRRGASWSSNCFQTSSAFGFLAFIVGSRVGIRGVESSQAKEKTRLNTENTGAGARRQRGRQLRARGNAAQKEKGQNRAKPQFYPRVSIPQLKRFASAIFTRPKPRQTP